MTALEASELKLRFVPLDRLLVHEETNPFRVERLKRALARDGKLRNPPIVTECGDRYIVLDGATRTNVLREMGFRDGLVQIVDYEADTVCLQAWNHVVIGLAPNRLLAILAEIDELRLQATTGKEARRLLQERSIAAHIQFPGGQDFAVFCEGGVTCQAAQLCQLVGAYRGIKVHRTTGDNLQTLAEQYPDLSALVVFPRFQPPEIVQIAMTGGKLPMGVTRHIISGRALGLGIPLDKLTDGESLADKNDWLDSLIRRRLQAHKIRLYEEPVFVFDD